MLNSYTFSALNWLRSSLQNPTKLAVASSQSYCRFAERNENLLIGLLNNNGRACINQSCNDVLEWADGTPFNYGSHFGQEIIFTEGMGCAHIDGMEHVIPESYAELKQTLKKTPYLLPNKQNMASFLKYDITSIGNIGLR